MSDETVHREAHSRDEEIVRGEEANREQETPVAEVPKEEAREMMPATTEDYIEAVIDRVNRAQGAQIGPGQKWQPNNWKTKYEIVIAMHVQGYANTVIAERTNYTPRHVQQIIDCDAVQAILKGMRQRIFSATMATIPERIGLLENSAMSNMEKVLNDGVLLETNPIQIYDRSKDFLQATGRLGVPNKNGNGGSNTQVNVQVIQQENAQRFVSGINKAEQYQARQPKALSDGDV